MADASMDPQAADLLAFWLGTDPAQPLANSARWFERSDAFDAEVRERFGALLERAGRGELEPWRGQPRGALALVVLLDQLSRNIHRDSPVAFAQDALAVAVALECLERGWDATLTPVERWFLIMPLMHAEDAAHQRRCAAYLGALAAETEGAVGDALQGARDYAERHCVVIERFGRFPHRNAVLGRPTPPAEQAWLAEHSQGF